MALAVLPACSDDGDSAGDGGQGADGKAEPARVRVVSQNLLHGIACPEGSDNCNLPGRVALFAQQLEDADCPELVGLQESNGEMVSLLEEELAGRCDDEYEFVFDEDPGVDREVVLTTRTVLGSRRTRLAGPLRTALWVRVAADVGVVDFVSTHLASGSDNRPCDRETCPPPCDGDEQINECQGKQVVEFAEEVAAENSLVIIGGDLNARPDEPTIAAVTGAGFADSHLDIGNPECDTSTGEQCTSGRVDDALTDLTDPDSKQTERIDYLLYGADRGCTAVDPTGLFNGEPADPPGDGGLVFPADHTGVQATIECPTTAAQREAATDATVASTAPPETAPSGGEPDEETVAAITESFRNVFDGDVTDVEQKLASIEDGELLRPYFLESYEAQKDIVGGVRVRIDDMSMVDDTHADVTYSVLLNDAVVLDHLPGAAIKIDDKWLVTRRTYCDVSTTGASEIPPPCQ
jgi:endonuclease/exonuclease/phosphatase family metal-dependent hydrolase